MKSVQTNPFVIGAYAGSHYSAIVKEKLMN